MKTEKEKMLAGELYDPAYPELDGKSDKTHKTSQEHNAIYDTHPEKTQRINHKLHPNPPHRNTTHVHT